MDHDTITRELRAIAATEPRCRLVETDGRALRKVGDEYEVRLTYEVGDTPCFACVRYYFGKPVENLLAEVRAMVEMAGCNIGSRRVPGAGL